MIWLVQEQGIEVAQCQLDKFVASSLRELNWRIVDGKYVHDLYSEGFVIQDLEDDAVWRKVGHYVRESYRAHHFVLYGQTGRHELSGHDFPPYDPKRRDLACKWAQKDGLAWLLVQGAVQSPQVRFHLRNVTSRCHECGAHNPTWEHLWKCFTGEEVPEDVLLLRHLWPREAKDLTVCQKFLDGLSHFNHGQWMWICCVVLRAHPDQKVTDLAGHKDSTRQSTFESTFKGVLQMLRCAKYPPCQNMLITKLVEMLKLKMSIENICYRKREGLLKSHTILHFPIASCLGQSFYQAHRSGTIKPTFWHL